MPEQAETLNEELERLVREWETGDGSEKEEAWNLIADFAVENCQTICAALRAAAQVRDEAKMRG